MTVSRGDGSSSTVTGAAAITFVPFRGADSMLSLPVRQQLNLTRNFRAMFPDKFQAVIRSPGRSISPGHHALAYGAIGRHTRPRLTSCPGTRFSGADYT
jgi:hypothetical protein